MSAQRDPSSGVAVGAAVVYVWSSMRATHEEEILMFDLGTIVSFMGGSLSLFLGVSCLSVATFLGGKASSLARSAMRGRRRRRRKTKNLRDDLACADR